MGAQDAVMSVRVCKENLFIIHSNYTEDKLLDQKGDGDDFLLQTLASRQVPTEAVTWSLDLDQQVSVMKIQPLSQATVPQVWVYTQSYCILVQKYLLSPCPQLTQQTCEFM